MPRDDLVITGARIWTGDPAAPWAEAVAIRGDRIVAIGTNDELAARTAARVVDAGGRLVVPGANDAHVHAPDTPGEDWVEAPIDGDDATGAEILAAVETAAKTAPTGAWIHGNLGVVALDDPVLDRDALDRAAPANPVWLENFAGHVLIGNRAAMHAFGLDDHPSGRLHEYERFRAMQGRMMALDDAVLRTRIDAFSDEAIGLGVTTVQVMSNTVDHHRLVELLDAHPPAVRWHVIRFPLDGVATVDDPRPLRASDRVSLSGTKYILDGTPIERGAAFEQDYADRAGVRGKLDFDRDQVAAMLREALRSGDPLHLHVSGDRSLHLVLDLMEELADDATWRAQRLVIEHGDAVVGADVERVRRLGAIVVQNPVHFTTPGLMATRLGPDRAGWFAIRTIVEAGVPFALGSDGPLSPWLNMMFAVTHPTTPAQALTREQVLVAYTAGSAYGEQLERDKGTLAVGMIADLAVLSQDVLAVPLDELPATVSVLTVVGGEIVHSTL